MNRPIGRLPGSAAADCIAVDAAVLDETVRLRHVAPMDATHDAIADPGLRQLLMGCWQRELARDPLAATKRGEHSLDDRLMDNSVEGFAARVVHDREALAAARAIDPASLCPDDRLNLELFADTTEARLRVAELHPEQIGASAFMSPLHYAHFVAEAHVFRSAEDDASYLARCRGFATYLDDEAAGFRAGLARGRTATRTSIDRALDLVRRQLEAPAASWVLATPHRRAPDAAFTAHVCEIVDQVLRPAMTRYAAFLHDELLPAGRDPAHAGLCHLPGGDALYRAWLRMHTTVAVSPEALMARGLEEVARLRDEVAALGGRELPEVLAWLRDAPELRFHTADEILETARRAVTRATQAAPAWFRALPRAGCEVQAIPTVQAPHAPPGTYRPPNAAGGPGIYFVRTRPPQHRRRWEAEEVAFHEAVPGHHLQKALAIELTQLPPFRAGLRVTAYSEGWALYAERLADEMGLYSTPVDRLGMACADLLRCARLVVDTGLHAFGWDRARAERYLRDLTPYDPELVASEVDRFLGAPGQACAYKVGALEIARLRAEAEATLGPRFDVRRFHGAVLDAGPLTLPVLAHEVGAWVMRDGDRS